MYIRVTQILEGGIDLTNLQELPRSILLVCGEKSALMPVSQEQLAVIISLVPDKPVATPKLSESPPVDPTFFEEEEEQQQSTDPGDEYNDPETGVSAL